MIDDFIDPMNFQDIDDFISAIEKKYNNKKRNNYDDESLTVSPDGRNQHHNTFDDR